MLKKLIATSAAAAVVASQLTIGLVYGAPTVNDPEMIDAISWGYDAGLTKYSGTDTFMPYANLTREQFAKFASEFGMTVLGLDEVAGNCSFSDLADADSTLTASITAACELGLMMGHDGKFMPKQEVTRGQVATVVSRMLGEIDPMSSEQAHFELLNSMGIMKYAMLSQSILRGDMMLMLYRLAIDNNGLCDIDPSLCNPNGTGDNNPPVVKEGNLNISMNSASPANLSSVPMSGSVKFATVDFTAGSKDITVNSVTLKRSGLGNASDIDRVYFEKDGIRVSSRASISSDQTVVLSFAPAMVVAAGTSESIDLYADMGATSAGGEHMFQSTSIDSSAANVVGSITTPTLRTANYTVSNVAITGAGAGLTATATDAVDLELGQFKITDNSTSSDERDLLFKSITLRQNGDGDLTSLSNVGLYRNGVKVSTVTVMNGKDITFGLGAGNEIQDGQTATYYIRANVNYVDGADGDTYIFRLRNTSDLNIIEATTSFRASVSGTPTLATYTVNGADVQFRRDTAFALSNSVSPGTNGAVLLKGTISSKTPIYLEDVTIPVTLGMSGTTITNSFKLRIGGSTFTWTPTAASSGTVNATFDGSVAINGTAEVEITADIKSTASATTLKFGSLALSAFDTAEYQNTQNSIESTASVGSIEGATITIVASKLAVTRNDGISSKTIVNGAQDQLLFGATFSTSQDNAIRVNQFTLSGFNASNHVASGFNNDLTATLYDAQGNAVKTATYNNGKVTFFGLNMNVAKNSPVAWTVRGNFVAGATGTLTLTLTDVDAVDTVTSNTVTVSDVEGGDLTIDGSATLDVAANSSVQSQLLYGGQQNVTLAQFNLEAKNDAVDLTDLYIRSAGNIGGALSNKINNVQLTDGTNSWYGSIRNGVIAFEGMSNNALAISTTKTFTLKGDINDVQNTADLTGSFTFVLDTGNVITDQAAGTYSGVRAISKSNGQLVNTVSTPSVALSQATKIVRGAISVAKTNITPTSSEFARFDVTAKGNRVQVTGFTFNLVNTTGAGQTGNVVNIYKNGLGGDLVYSGAEGTINFSGNGANMPVEISNGQTVTFSIKVINPIATLNGTTANPMGLTLNNVTYLDKLNDGDALITDSSSYKNTGAFPFTWSQ